MAPVAKLADGSRLHVVGTRGPVPVGRFVSPGSLDTSLSSALVDSLRTAPGRPARFLPGWFDLVEA
ncbi:hypothetical protein [Nocardioides sp. B-3]|uniref:hypothetical protein n=1 Tax=Nocardioides sp. B-3 TaxID=2895565 RepID=UPI0021521D1F|nr:hypothetical protein [Nocardioides sp. B-3]UUZ61378.1 hypothetical protein LP418_12840 [Nocardioides sp. B-3]